MSEFTNKVGVVTGTTGIGRAIALRLAQGDARVVAFGIDAQANRDLAAEAARLNLDLSAEACDVSDPASVERAVHRAVERLGRIDILVNAAAIHPFGDVVESD